MRFASMSTRTGQDELSTMNETEATATGLINSTPAANFPPSSEITMILLMYGSRLLGSLTSLRSGKGTGGDFSSRG